MVSALLLFVTCAVAAVSGYAHVNYPVICSKLKPVRNIQLPELEGSWVTVEALLLRDGYPEPPAHAHRKTCVRTFVSDASSSGMSMVSEVHQGDVKRRTGRTKFTINDPTNPGRWSLTSRRPSSLVTEMLALAHRADQFLVLAFCQPYSEDEESGTSKPALWVKILARSSRGLGALVDQGPSLGISKRELVQLRERVAEMLGLRSLASVHFDTSC